MATEWLGPMAVYIDPDGDNVELETEGGVTINSPASFSPITTDKTGTTPKNKIGTGAGEVTFTVNVVDHDLDVLALIFPNATQIGTGATSRVEIRSNVGTSLVDLAQKVVMKKLTGTTVSTDTSEWITFFLATPQSVAELSYKKDAQTIYAVTFACFPDPDRNNRIWAFGDEDAS